MSKELGPIQYGKREEMVFLGRDLGEHRNYSDDVAFQIDKEVRKLVDSPEVQKQIHNEGGDPITSTPPEYAADIDKEEKKWGGLVKKLGLKVE